MWKRYLALALAGLLLLACTACGKGAAGPFQFARRVMTYYDLDYNSQGEPVIEQGEVLVFFIYMEPFDPAQENTRNFTAWAAEAVDHASSLQYMGEALRKTGAHDGSALFSGQVSCGVGVAVSETWMLPEREYRAAYRALMTVALSEAAQERADYWLVFNQGNRGYRSESYDKSASFYIHSYLPEDARSNAHAIYMSTGLMREFFPFLGRVK